MGTEKQYEHAMELDQEVEVDLNWKPPKEDADEPEIVVEGEDSEPKEEKEEVKEEPRQPDPEVVALRRRIDELDQQLRQRDEVASRNYIQHEERELDSRLEATREKLKQAQKDGDTDATAAAIEELADIKAEKKKREVVNQQRPQAPPSNPLTEQWVAKNPWFGAGPGKDRVATLAAKAIDQDLWDEGYRPNTPAYFDEMARRLKGKVTGVAIVGITDEPRAPKAPPPPTTAASRQRPPARPGVVRLDPKSDFAVMRTVGLDPDKKEDRIAYAKSKAQYRD